VGQLPCPGLNLLAMHVSGPRIQRTLMARAAPAKPAW
jgi:hypothetical protein